MGFFNDLRLDRDKCSNCQRVLYDNYAGRDTRQEIPDDYWLLTIEDIICSHCQCVTSIIYMAEPAPDDYALAT